jgi:DNA-binding CsgD family transcriptional regulator
LYGQRSVGTDGANLGEGLHERKTHFVGTEIQSTRVLWLPALRMFDQTELEWQMMRRGLHPVQLAELAGVSPRTIYRALSGHRTQRRNAFAILTALNRVPVAIPI